MSASEQDAPQVADADIEFAINSLKEGCSAEAVQGKLVERGLAPDVATAIVDDLVMRAVYGDAIAMLN